MRGQLDLIGGLPFGETMPTAAVPEVQYTPAEPEPVPTRKKRRGIAPANSFEAWLSKRGMDIPQSLLAQINYAIAKAVKPCL